MIVYKDMTFCINDKCTRKCRKYLTRETELAAKSCGLPICTASFICLDQGEEEKNEIKKVS